MSIAIATSYSGRTHRAKIRKCAEQRTTTRQECHKELQFLGGQWLGDGCGGVPFGVIADEDDVDVYGEQAREGLRLPLRSGRAFDHVYEVGLAEVEMLLERFGLVLLWWEVSP
ncbi:hypothetical protein [Actinomadura pelletieri]|uniref:hypothetical protein n=1 Tax=Actinomadura pelletieri TaxID=111805 RepID=UPI0011C47DF2|nr:hypothetical protein [Actinomadura pelletieri]